MKVVLSFVALFAIFAVCTGHSRSRSSNIKKPVFKCDDPNFEWTEYFNSYKADKKGDFESLSEIVKRFPDDVCTHPTGIDYKLVSGHPYSSLSVSLKGLFCINSKNYWSRRCGDYKVRFCCPKEVVCEGEGNEFTPFYDISNPALTDGSDFETISAIQHALGPAAVCSNPTATDARLLTGKQAFLSDDYITIDETGLTCNAEDQKSLKCHNYKVRFCCPKVVTPNPVCSSPAKLTPFVESVSTSFGAKILLSDALEEFPERFCPNPISFIVERADGTPVNQTIIASTQFGLACFNSEQAEGKCKDFRMRFCCEEAICVEPGRVFTPFYDVSSLQNGNEIETIGSIQNIYGGTGAVCSDPTCADVRLLNGEPAANGGNNLIIDNFGVSCLGSQQGEGVQCKNYKVRFCCPIRQSVEPSCNRPRVWTLAFAPSSFGNSVFLPIAALQASGIVCNNPTSIELLESALTPPAEVVFADLDYGFTCFDPNPDVCAAYRVRFCCEDPIRTPPCFGTNEWSPWMNRDCPTDGSDIEEYAPPEARCFPSVSVDVRLAATGVSTLFYDDFLEVTPGGIRCIGSEQTDGNCDDYEVRLCCPRVYVEPDCSDDGSEWTEWYDRDTPDDTGDIECLQLLRNENRGQICKNPSSIEARVANTKLPYYTSSQFVEIGADRGLVCKNSNQFRQNCQNYEVRFCCPKVFENPNCSNGNEWTDWLSENTTEAGDFELLESYVSMGVCQKPSSIRARVVDTAVPSTLTGETLVTSPSFGLACENKLQESGNCSNYEVQFCCPIEYVDDSSCSGNSEWTAFYNQDGVTEAGDTECLYLHRLKNPNDNICKDPSSIDVEIVNGTGDYLDQSHLVSVSPYGFFCNSPSCEDYKVRYCCPKRFLEPSCLENSEWTTFQNSDEPETGSGDIEPVTGCRNPSSIEATLVSNNQSYQTGGDFVTLSPTGGLKCINEEQFDGSCNDYQVRFCCPINDTIIVVV